MIGVRNNLDVKILSLGPAVQYKAMGIKLQCNITKENTLKFFLLINVFLHFLKRMIFLTEMVLSAH